MRQKLHALFAFMRINEEKGGCCMYLGFNPNLDFLDNEEIEENDIEEVLLNGDIFPEAFGEDEDFDY